jgi:hypothetical protein
MRLRSILIPCTLFFALSAAHADDASKTAKVEELFKVAHIDRLSTQVMQQTFDQINSGMMQQMMGLKLTPEQQKRVDEFSAKVQTLIADGLGWKSLEPDYAKLYEATYTEEEIDGILAFYKSPSGQAMVEKSPLLVKRSSEIAQERMQAIMPQLQQLMKEYMTQAAAPDAKVKE